jgi:hypothetical protein
MPRELVDPLDDDLFEEAEMMATILGITIEQFVADSVQMNLNQRAALPESKIQFVQHVERQQAVVQRFHDRAARVTRKPRPSEQP